MLTVFLELNISNPYATGMIIDYGNQEIYLENTSFSILQSPHDRLYELEEGDELTQLSFLAYGSSKWWWLIYVANPNILYHPLDLPTGKKILIPDLNTYLANN